MSSNKKVRTTAITYTCFFLLGTTPNEVVSMVRLLLCIFTIDIIGDTIEQPCIGGVMEKLVWTDHRKISNFASELSSLRSITAISEQIVNRLDTFVGGNSVLIVQIDSDLEVSEGF
jgi:hypothetical protein